MTDLLIVVTLLIGRCWYGYTLPTLLIPVVNRRLVVLIVVAVTPLLTPLFPLVVVGVAWQLHGDLNVASTLLLTPVVVTPTLSVTVTLPLIPTAITLHLITTRVVTIAPDVD